MSVGSPPSPAGPLPRQVRSLSLLAQVAVVRQVHQAAADMETSYIDKWLESDLNLDNRVLEQRLDIRGGHYDTADVVRRFQATREEVMR